MNKFFKKKYDVIIIGSALAGMSAALRLKEKGMEDILVLEQHNLPGGVATSYVRDGVEYEASLHEMMSIGEERQLSAGRFFKEFGINIDWLRVPEAYHLVTPTIDCVVHAGTKGNFDVPARDIANACEDKDGSIYKKVLSFLEMCLRVHNASEYITLHKCSKLKMIFKFPDLVKTAGYSAKEVMDAYGLPKKAQDILSAYWIYVGNTVDDLPFNVYGYLLASYLGYGAYIPKNTSHEMSLKMAEKCQELGVQIEFGQRVDKILVKDKKAYGIRLSSGEEIHANAIISGAYPSTVYSKMIDPCSEIPPEAKKYVNSRETSLTCFTITLLLDATPDKLHMDCYSTFYAPKGMDSNLLWENLASLGPYEYLTTICLNYANPSAVPEGKTLYSIAILPRPEAWKNVKEEDYFSLKNRIASNLIEQESKRLGVNLKDHLENCVIETPVSISHYVGAYQGSIYGYKHSMKDSVVARNFMEKEERYIQGLFFAGAHQLMGDGMSPCIGNGQHAALQVVEYLNKGGKENEN